MIPLITHTPRLTLLAASRALLTAELHKPRYFGTLLGAEMPLTWPPPGYDRTAMQTMLEALTDGGRDAAGWYGWYALRKAHDEVPRTLVGLGGFLGPPDATGEAEIRYWVAADWRTLGLGTELVAGLIQQAEATGLVRRLVARVPADNEAAGRVLLGNGFVPEGADAEGLLRFGRDVAGVG